MNTNAERLNALREADRCDDLGTSASFGTAWMLHYGEQSVYCSEAAYQVGRGYNADFAWTNHLRYFTFWNAWRNPAKRALAFIDKRSGS